MGFSVEVPKGLWAGVVSSTGETYLPDRFGVIDIGENGKFQVVVKPDRDRLTPITLAKIQSNRTGYKLSQYFDGSGRLIRPGTFFKEPSSKKFKVPSLDRKPSQGMVVVIRAQISKG